MTSDLEESVKVSIIVTNYNLKAYIKEAIDSLLNQACDFNYEIILVDDASTDGSLELLRGIKDERLKLIALEENVGAAAAINIGYKHATGEYMCRFDGDDKWYPEYLSKAAAVLDENPDVVLVHCDVSFINSQGAITSERGNIVRPAHLKPKDFEFLSILERYYINAPAIMARRSSWDMVLPWPEEFREGLGDWFLTLRMLEGKLSYFISEPLAYYRIHNTNMHRSMILNGAGERNTHLVLNYFRKNKSVTAEQWRVVYFAHFRHLGNSYFHAGMEKDASRCLLIALKNHPSSLFDLSFMRIFVASKIGKIRYEKLKKLIPAR